MKRIDVPGVGLVDFPDSMTDADITSAIESDILKAPSQASTPKAPERTFGGTVKEAAGYIKDNALRLPLAIADELRTKSVVDGMDGKEVKPDQAAAKSFKKVIEANKKPNTLNKGAEIVDGFSGVAKVGLNRGYAGLGKMEAGLIKSIADITDSETLAKVAENQNAYAKEIENRAVLRGTPVEGFAKESIVQALPEAGANAISSVINTAPALVVGAATGGSALPAMFGGVALQEYNEGREKDLSPLQSAFRSAPMAAAEVVGEKLGGFDKLTKGLNKAVKGNGIAELGTAMLESSLKELPAEEFTTTLQFLVDKTPEIGLNQNATFEDYKQAVKDTALATILQSGGMAAGGTVLNSIATKLDAPAGTKEAAQIDAKLLAAFNASQQKQQDEAKTAEADNALANITNPDATVDDAIALAEKALDIPAAPVLLNSITDTDLLTQVQGATEAINAADILGDDNVSNTNDAATGLATGASEGADNQPQRSVDDLSLQSDGSGLGNATETLTSSEPGNVATRTGSNTDSTLDRPFAAATDEFLPQMRSMTTDATVISQRDAEIALRGIDAPSAVEVAGEKINKEWTAFNPDTGTLNIPRSEMSQIKAEHRGAMVNFLNARGISHEQETVPASSLKPTQQEFSEAKVKQASEYVGGDRSILVSSDNHVLDGHHQWLSKLQNGDNVDVIRLNAPIKDLLSNVSEFPSAQVAEGAKEVSSQKPKTAKPKAPKIKSLLTIINDLGGILNSEKLDITGEQRGFAPGGYNKIFKLNSKRSLKGLIEGGDLDEYLPYNMRLESNGANDDAFDSTEAYDYLADRIRNGESVLPYAVEEELRALQYEGNAVADVADELTEDEINGQLQQASNEERESATNAQIFNTDSENGGAGSGERTESATETNTSKQTEVTAQPNQDLLGDNTDEKQALADEERAKDAKRNSGTDNPESFTLTGSKSEADQAAAAGAQDLFAQPMAQQDEVTKAAEALTAAGVKGKEKLDTIKDVRQGNLTADEVAEAYAETDIAEEVDSEPNATPVGRITDFGEKLEGAKKDLWKNYQKAMGDELPADAKDITLSKHFPEPDYDNLIASGMDIKAIAAIKAMRDEIPSKPKMPSKVRRWGAELGLLRDLSNKLINQEYGIDKLLADMSANPNLSKFVDRIEMYAELGFPAMKSAKGYNITGGWTSFKEGVPENEKQTALEYPNGKREYFKDRQGAIDALRAKLEVAPEGTARKTKLDVYRVTRTGEIMIGKKVASNKYIDLKGGFKTPKEAFQFYADNEADLLQLLEQRKNVRPERRSVNNPRVGIDYRLGQDVTPEKFAAEFGFRGVQFGNYIEQARRPRDLNNAYDALLDLANIIGVPPRAISLNGTLGLAFGARGSGGKNPAAAHFERGEVVINLTKVNGFGSLGHEWFHAMDNYFSKARGDNEYLTQKPQQKRTYKAGEGFELDESIRPEMLTAFKNLMDSIRKSDYYIRSSKIDNTRTNDYWSTAEELAARAFEAYLIAKSKEDGKSNDYLANIEDEDVYNIANQAARDFGAFEDPYPYPTRAEQEEINPLFDALFAELKTKEADDGNVVLFSRNNATKDIPDAIILNDLGSAKNSNDYELAKSGDAEAATRLAKLLVTDDIINQLKQLAKESDFIAGVTSIESTGNNALPEAAALLISEKLDVPYDENIVQSSSPKRTGMNGLDRIFNRPLFEGDIVDGAGYIFVDDTITQGGTFAALSAHVKDGGGSVVANIALTGKQYSSKIALSEDALSKVRTKFGDLENEFKQSTGYGYEGLTASEARYLTSGISLEQFRNRITEESQKAASNPDSQASQRNGLDTPSFSSSQDIGIGLPKQSIQQAVNSLRSTWKNAPEIIVVDDMNDPAIRKAVRDENERQLSQGAQGQPEAFFDNGKVYIVASEMNSADDVIRVVLHEALGHYGLRGLYGKELGAILDQIAMLRKRDMAAKAKEYGLDLNVASDKRIAAEEVLAEMAQTAPGAGFVKRAIAAIRNFLRAAGIKLKLTDNDIIVNYLLPARGFVVNGRAEQGVRGLVAAFARDNRSPSKESGDTFITAALEFTARNEELFENPTSEEKSIDGIAKALNTKFRVEPFGKSQTKLDGAEKAWEVFLPDAKYRSAVIYEKGDEVWINVSRLQSGGDFGSRIYSLAADYAINNDKVFIGDPLGLTEKAFYRRAESMLSSALKYGTTKHIAPHLAQEIPAEYYESQGNAEFGKSVRPINWIAGDDVNNIKELIYTVYKGAIDNLPELKNVIFNPTTQQFETVSGEQFTTDDFERVLSGYYERTTGNSRSSTADGSTQNAAINTTQKSNSYRAGIRTAKRAALFNTFLREQSSELRNKVLGSYVRELQNRGLADSLKGTFYSRSNPQSSVPEETRAQATQRVIQDKFNRFKVLQDWVISQGVNLSEAADVFLSETLMSGRISTRKEDFREGFVKPLIERTQSAGITMEQVGDYLKVQHAPEANKRARELQGDVDATAYGISDADAAAAMKDFKALPNFAELKTIANEWRSITDKTKQIKLDSGLLTPEMVAAWENTYDVYVPVKGGDDNIKAGLGKGLHVNGKTKQRLGHGLRDEAIIENILRDHESAITLDEKNRVGKALIKFALEVQNDDIITISKPVKRKVLKQGETAYVVAHKGLDLASFDTRLEANMYIQAQAALGATRSDFSIDKTKDPVRVMLQASPMLADNEVNVYIAGHAVRVQINDEIAAREYKNLGVEHLNSILGASREINNFLSKVYTGYSPDFILTNPIRDAIQGFITLTGNEGFTTAAKIFANYPNAVKELVKHFKNKGSSSLVNEYRAMGGSTGGAYLSDLERIGNDIQASFDEYSGARATYDRVYTKSISEGKSKKTAHTMAALKSGISGFKKIPVIGHFLSLMENLNAITENALRVATYKTLSESGMSKAKSAAQAKNLMNFNRKGEKSNAAGALYLFFNPSIQGTKLIYDALFDSPHKNQARALAGSMTLAAITVGLMQLSGDDEDKEKWNNTPDYVKDGNLVIDMFGVQITITLPYGYRMFWTLGNVILDAQQGKDLDKLAIRLASSVFENVSAIGKPIDENGDINLFQVLPTTPKMAVGATELVNQDNFGNPITPRKWKESTPDSQLMNRGTYGSLYDTTASGLNSITGGSDFEAGLIDVSPETLKYWVKSLTGGTGQFVLDSGNIIINGLQGVAPQDARDIPVVRRFVRETGIRDLRAAFWERKNEADVAAGQLADAKKARDIDAFTDLADRKGVLASMAKVSNRMIKMANVKRDLVAEIKADETLSLSQKIDEINKIENEESEIYDMFISMYDNNVK